MKKLTACLNPYSTGSWVAGEYSSNYFKRNSLECLNPYSTGSWVAGDIDYLIVCKVESLNPYSTGSWVAGKQLSPCKM